jgi:hypothetical protein
MWTFHIVFLFRLIGLAILLSLVKKVRPTQRSISVHGDLPRTLEHQKDEQGMKLMRLEDVPAGERGRIFRYSPARALLVAITLLCASAGLILLGWHRRAILAYYIAGVLILGLIVMRRFIRARLRSSNWLVRMSGEGLRT